MKATVFQLSQRTGEKGDVTIFGFPKFTKNRDPNLQSGQPKEQRDTAKTAKKKNASTQR